MTLEKIIQIIGEKMDLDVSKINENATFESLHIDSLDMVEIIMDIEEAFDISIEEASDLRTVGDLVRYIEKQAK